MFSKIPPPWLVQAPWHKSPLSSSQRSCLYPDPILSHCQVNQRLHYAACRVCLPMHRIDTLGASGLELPHRWQPGEQGPSRFLFLLRWRRHSLWIAIHLMCTFCVKICVQISFFDTRVLTLFPWKKLGRFTASFVVNVCFRFFWGSIPSDLCSNWHQMNMIIVTKHKVETFKPNFIKIVKQKILLSKLFWWA